MAHSRTSSTFVPVAFAACAASVLASGARAQASMGGMSVMVTVLEPVRPIALLHPVDPPRVAVGVTGPHATMSIGVSLETPFTVRVRALGGGSATGPAPLVRMRGGAGEVLGTGVLVLAHAVPAGAHDLAIEFAAVDDGAAQLTLPTTEVTITAIDGDAMTEATATFGARALPLPVLARSAAPVPQSVALAARGRGRQ